MSVSIGKRTFDILNNQVTEELASYYLYLSMASALTNMGLPGCAKWMIAQAEEEQEHAMRIFEHIEKRGEQVRLRAIQEPKADWPDAVSIFENMAEHEAQVTALINAIYESAVAEHDHATACLMQWFINEQVEEEDTAQALLDKVRKLQSCESGMALFDAELGKR